MIKTKIPFSMTYMILKEDYTMTEKKMENNGTVGAGVDFERIRRITGYLVGTTDRWNNAKRAEERDRVKHSLTR